MADCYLIKIDLEAMARNLRQETPAMTADGVREWLGEMGITQGADGFWMVEEVQLAIFSRGEILCQNRVI